MTEKYTNISVYPENLKSRKYGFLFSAWPYGILRLMLCFVFLGSGFVKLMDLMAFAVLIGDFGLIPESFTFPAAMLLSMAEVLVGAALVFDVRGSLGAMAGLVLFFMMVLGYGIFMGFDMDCGCFGPSMGKTDLFSSLELSFVRDTMLLIGILTLYMWRRLTARSPVHIKNALSFPPLERNTR